MNKEEIREVLDEYTTKKSNKISWGWVIFWLILFWPAAIAYILIKMFNKKN